MKCGHSVVIVKMSSTGTQSVFVYDGSFSIIFIYLFITGCSCCCGVCVCVSMYMRLEEEVVLCSAVCSAELVACTLSRLSVVVINNKVAWGFDWALSCVI